MSDSWFDKAKEAAAKAGEEAKKLATAAKNANYGEMLDKTKAMAQQATEEAKKAAGAVSSAMNKPKDEAAPATPATTETVQSPVQQPAPTTQTTVSNEKLEQCLTQLQKIETLLQDIKQAFKQ